MKNIRLGDKGWDGNTLWADDEKGIPRPVCTFTEFGMQYAEEIVKLEIVKLEIVKLINTRKEK